MPRERGFNDDWGFRLIGDEIYTPGGDSYTLHTLTTLPYILEANRELHRMLKIGKEKRTQEAKDSKVVAFPIDRETFYRMQDQGR